MFTGIIASVGEVVALVAEQKGLRLTISAGKLDLSDVILGDSIAHNGICLTVIELNLQQNHYKVDVSPETINCTCGFTLGEKVNLEKALRYSDRLGGHLLSGHVDGVARIAKIDNIGEYLALTINCPSEFLPYIAKKGSITVHGVSLTVNEVLDDAFQILLIPQTLQETNLSIPTVGDKVNIEVDMLARYIARMLPYLMANKLINLHG